MKKKEGNEEQRKRTGKTLGSSKQRSHKPLGAHPTQKAPHPGPGKTREQ